VGTGWFDPDGFEVGDKCEVGPQIGSPLGYAANGSPYDQLVGGHEYLIQEMWSNDDGGCVQRTTQTASPLPLPQINLTQFSSAVSGNIGSNTAGGSLTDHRQRDEDAGRLSQRRRPQRSAQRTDALAGPPTTATGDLRRPVATYGER
jgi:hypothetical protein